jgi:surfactin synthase thioesterase subunit
MSRWILRLPRDGEPIIVAFPYAGMGASSYSGWPSHVAGASVLAVQPPGRENRMREACCPSPQALAEAFAPELAELLPRPMVFTGHCGAVPYALETARAIRALGGDPPLGLIASSWGAPHLDIYGPLNHRPFADIDAEEEVRRMIRRLHGREEDDDLVELYAEILMDDLHAMRGYRFAAGDGLPCPVTVVGWDGDTVVPTVVCHAGWDELGPVRHHTLSGPHESYLGCPAELQAVVTSVLRREPADVR